MTKTIEEIAAEKSEELRVAKLTPEQIAAEDKKVEEEANKILEESKKEEGNPDGVHGEEGKESGKEGNEEGEEEVKAEEKPPVVPDKPKVVGKRQEEIQKEIDMLISQKKALQHEVGDFTGILDQIKELKTELAEVKAGKAPAKDSSPQDLAKEHVSKQVAKFIEEDKDLPREERREMPKDELELWLAEDMAEAMSWMNRRDYRREKEKDQFVQQSTQIRSLEELQKKQKPYLDELLTAFPELKIETKVQELQKAGKTEDEIEAVMSKDNIHYKTMMEIVKSDPKRFLGSINGPALVAEELKKRLKTPAKKNISADDEDRIRQEAAEAERQRQANLDAGIHSNGGNGKLEKVEENLSEFEKRVMRMALRKGVTAEKYKAMVDRRKRMGFDSDANLEEHRK